MPATPQMQIDVETEYLDDHLPETENKFAFAYKIAIRNLGTESVQLINRYWLITDGNGKKTEVHGPGVVGKQPIIGPGKCHRYVSAAILDTPVGSMQGHYEMRDFKGQMFEAPIAVFRLAVPNLIN
jgi:ApaG protein